MIEVDLGFATILGAVVAELGVGEGFGVIVEVVSAAVGFSVGFTVGFSAGLSNLAVKSPI